MSLLGLAETFTRCLGDTPGELYLSVGGGSLLGLVDRHNYLGATPGELSFSISVLPDTSGSCHVAHCTSVSAGETVNNHQSMPAEARGETAGEPRRYPRRAGFLHVDARACFESVNVKTRSRNSELLPGPRPGALSSPGTPERVSQKLARHQELVFPGNAPTGQALIWCLPPAISQCSSLQ